MYKLYLGWFEVNRAYSAQELREALQKLDSTSRRLKGSVGGHRWTCHFDSLGDLVNYARGIRGQLSRFRVSLEEQIPENPDFQAITMLVDASSNQFYVFHVENGRYIYKRTFPYSPNRLAEGELWTAKEMTTNWSWIQIYQHFLNEDELKNYEVVRPE